MQAIVLPEKILDEVNRIIFRFIWRKKECNRKAFEKVKRSVMCNKYEKRGIRSFRSENYAGKFFVTMGYTSMSI